MSVVIEGVREDSLRRCDCRFDGNCTTCFASIVVELETVGSERAASLGHLAPYQLYNQTTCSVVLRSTTYNVCVSALPPMSPPKTTCLLPSTAGGVGEVVVSFLSHLKEVKQLRKVVMTACRNLSPSLIAAICGGLCSSNSMEEVEVTSYTTVVSALFACLTTPYKLLSSVNK